MSEILSGNSYNFSSAWEYHLILAQSARAVEYTDSISAEG